MPDSKIFRVRFYKNCTTSDRHTIAVQADSPEAARQRVLDWGQGRIDLTRAEEGSENLEREGEVIDSVFEGLEDEDQPYAVVQITAEPLPKWDVFAAHDGQTYRGVVEAEDEDAAKAETRPIINSTFRMGFTGDQIAADPTFFDGELDGFLVEEKS